MSERRPQRGSGPRSSGPRAGRGPAGPRSSHPRTGSTAPGRSSTPGSTRGNTPGNTRGGTRGGVRRPHARPRITGRAAILVLVLVVLTVSYASSLRAYLQQRDHIGDLRAQIAETDQDIEELEREKQRWQDEKYVETQARERFGYVMAGETGYRVIDEDGEPVDDASDELTDPDDLPPPVPEAWWDGAWESVLAAGNPEDYDPAEKIRAPRE